MAKKTHQIEKTVVQIKDADYKYFKEQRNAFRIKRTEGVIAHELVNVVAAELKLPPEYILAIFSGTIPTIDIPSDEIFEFDKNHFKKSDTELEEMILKQE